jgi:hypothetical protein
MKNDGTWLARAEGRSTMSPERHDSSSDPIKRPLGVAICQRRFLTTNVAVSLSQMAIAGSANTKLLAECWESPQWSRCAFWLSAVLRLPAVLSMHSRNRSGGGAARLRRPRAWISPAHNIVTTSPFQVDEGDAPVEHSVSARQNEILSVGICSFFPLSDELPKWNLHRAEEPAQICSVVL